MPREAHRSDEEDQLAKEFEDFAFRNGIGDPDGKPHRKDDPATVAEMAAARGA